MVIWIKQQQQNGKRYLPIPHPIEDQYPKYIKNSRKKITQLKSGYRFKQRTLKRELKWPRNT